METVTKNSLFKKVVNLGVNGNVAKVAVQSFIDCIVDSIKKGEKVQISGFGTFIIRNRKERICRNPKTGEKVIVPARCAPAFKPSELLKKWIGNGK
ncbi:MAG: HU family DNA-binding protein [Candidatus Firestonebacteria bacterium]|nr:HU family DNA-binding protein [Candidatus Firestonebacteria bacterium]